MLFSLAKQPSPLLKPDDFSNPLVQARVFQNAFLLHTGASFLLINILSANESIMTNEGSCSYPSPQRLEKSLNLANVIPYLAPVPGSEQ